MGIQVWEGQGPALKRHLLCILRHVHLPAARLECLGGMSGVFPADTCILSLTGAEGHRVVERIRLSLSGVQSERARKDRNKSLGPC